MAAHFWRSVSPLPASSSGPPPSNGQTITPHPPSPAPPSPTATAAASSITYATCALVFTGIQAARQDFEGAMERERDRRRADVAASEEAVRRRAEDLAAGLREREESLAARAAAREEALEARLARLEAEAQRQAGRHQDAGERHGTPQHPSGGAAEEVAAATQLADLSAKIEALQARVEALARDSKRYTDQEVGGALRRRGSDADSRWEDIQEQVREGSLRQEQRLGRLEAAMAESDDRHHDSVVRLSRDCAGLEIVIAESSRHHNDDMELLRKDYAGLERAVSENDRRHSASVEESRKDYAILKGTVSESCRRRDDSVVLLREDCNRLTGAVAESDRRQQDGIALLRRDCASLEAVVVENDRRHGDNVEQLRRDCGRAERRCAATEERISSLQTQLDKHVARLLQQQDQQQQQQEPRGVPSRHGSVHPPSRAICRRSEPTFTDDAPASPPPSQTVHEAPAAETSGACPDDGLETKPVRARRPRNRGVLTKELKSLSTGDEGRGDLPKKELGRCTIPELLFTFDRRYRHQKPSPEHRFVRAFLQSVHDLLPERDRTHVEARFLSSQRGVFQRRQAEEALWCSISAKWHDVRLCMWSFQEVRDVLIPNPP